MVHTWFCCQCWRRLCGARVVHIHDASLHINSRKHRSPLPLRSRHPSISLATIPYPHNVLLSSLLCFLKLARISRVSTPPLEHSIQRLHCVVPDTIMTLECPIRLLRTMQPVVLITGLLMAKHRALSGASVITPRMIRYSMWH